MLYCILVLLRLTSELAEDFRVAVVFIKHYPRKRSNFCDMMSCSSLCRTYDQLYADFLLGLFFGSEMEARPSSETSVGFQRTAWRYVPLL
jgi:hypothetical protein